MVRAVALLALLAGAATPQPEPWVRIAAPADGADVELAGGTRLGFDFEVGGGGGVEGLVLCVQLTNKRLSYESYTHCGAASAPRTHFDLSGLLPGVWRARAFLRAGGAVGGESRRGAAVGAVGAADEAWFLADRGAWEREHDLDGRSTGGNGTRVARRPYDPPPSRGGSAAFLPVGSRPACSTARSRTAPSAIRFGRRRAARRR